MDDKIFPNFDFKKKSLGGLWKEKIRRKRNRKKGEREIEGVRWERKRSDVEER